MDISAIVQDLNTANCSIKSVVSINLFPGSLIINRDTFFELWKIDQADGSLSIVTTYKIRNKIKELKVFYSPVLQKDMVLVLIEDVRLIILNFDESLQEFEKTGMYNFKNFDDLSGKISNKNEENNCLGVFTNKYDTIISLALADRWIAVIKTKGKQTQKADTSEIFSERSDFSITKGEKLYTIFEPAEYYWLNDINISQVKDIKLFKGCQWATEEEYWAILYVKNVSITSKF